jgi:CHAT domain-containing protein/Flp pilus assembly protein TadD
MEVNLMDEGEAWFYRGCDELIAGNYAAALASFDKALHIKPDKHEAWHNRGVALGNVGRIEEALASYDKALHIKPDKHEAWYGRGVMLGNVGRIEEALASFDKALQFQPDLHEAWYGRGVMLWNVGRIEEALASYDKALYFKTDKQVAWHSRGVALGNVGQFEEAIASYDKALQFQPDFHVAWHGRGVALGNVGQFEEAIASYDKALQFQPDFHVAWYGRGIAARNSVSCDRFLAFQSAIARKHPALNQRGYEGALASYEQGLNYCPQDTHPEGWGRLHQAIGDAHYSRGRIDSRPRPYWHKAVKSYKEALKTLTAAFPERHLEVLQDLLRVYSDLGETQKVQVLLAEGTDLLWRLQQKTTSDTDKIRLSRKFASFDQLRVDGLAQSGNWCAALELAEQRKNLCLTWLQNRWSESVDNPNYAQMKELFKPSPQVSLTVQLSRGQDGKVKMILPKVKGQSVGARAIVYWHISPAAITTFILRYNQPSIILSAKNDLTPPAPLLCKGRGEHQENYSPLFAEDELGKRSNCSPLLVGEGLGERFFYPPSLRQLIEFENWIEAWKKDYQKYRQGTRQQNKETRRDIQETPVSSSEPNKWRDEMPKRLEKLAEILNIEGILPHLKGVRQLILIPHRDLHLLPLHALFPDDYTITYLPSIKVGLDRKPPKPNTSLLSVENPTNDLRFAPLESELICKLYPKNQRIATSAATKTAVKTALSQGFGIFHFAGHSEHNLDQPAQSALILANKERLTLKDILELDLSHYNLVGLSGCETNFTSKVGLIEEFVGLASGFVAAGANNVVGSLWNVSDRATAYFMRKFHEILIASDTDVPSALKQAQYLLRNVTNKELEEWETMLPSQLNQERSLRMPVQARDGETDDDVKPFESPYYWAAFCAIGL